MSQTIAELKNLIGKEALRATDSVLHLIDKDNFELYLVALEIRDEDSPLDNIKDMMIFPVNPDSIMYIMKTLTSIKKSFTGVHIIDNDTFVPSPINITGTFGRKIRTFYGNGIEVKTGFGTIKKLHELIKLSKSKNDNGKPYRTIFYCLPFSEVFTVEINECRFSQTMDRNRMWSYDLNMTAVAPGFIGNINESASIFNILSMNFLTKVINDTFESAKHIVWNEIKG